MSDVTTPIKWYETPLFKQVVGYVIGIALAVLAVRFGIQPPPVEIKLPDASMQAREVHYHFDSVNQPSVRQKE